MRQWRVADMAPVTMIATARATFAVDVASKRAQAARELLQELGATVVGPTDLVMDDAGVDAAAPFVAEAEGLLIHVCASFCDAEPARRLYAGVGRPVLLWAFREPGVAGDKLWLNSLCGANLIGHALVRDGGAVRLVYGDPDEPGLREILSDALAGRLPEAPVLPEGPLGSLDEAAADEALSRLDGQVIGAVGDAPRGFTPSEFSAELLSDTFGLTIEHLDLPKLFAEIMATPAEVRQAEVADAVEWQPSMANFDDTTLDRFAAVTTSLRDWQKRTGVSSLAVRCWPEFPTELGACPCSALSKLSDEGIPTQCERDVYGATTMLLLKALGVAPTYLVDTVDLDAERNLIRFWHCGAAATELAATPQDATQSVHCNRKIGVAGDFPLRTGPVIAVRLTEQVGNPGALRMLVASGQSVEAPNRFQGNTADVVLDGDAHRFVESLVTGGFPHHTVLAWTDVRPGLRAIADRLNIPLTEF